MKYDIRDFADIEILKYTLELVTNTFKFITVGSGTLSEDSWIMIFNRDYNELIKGRKITDPADMRSFASFYLGEVCGQLKKPFSTDTVNTLKNKS